MKLNNLATRTGLYSAIVLMFAACQSDAEKLNQLNSEIDNLENKIDNVYTHNEATDSAARNATVQILDKWIDEDSQHIENLRDRNYELSDSIRNAKIHRIAKKYPLSKFLSRDELKFIQAILRHGCSYCNEDAAKRIINGRGTLLDLYNVSFDLHIDNQLFRIIDPVGTVRFGDEKRDALCRKFDDERFAIYTAPQSNKEIESNLTQISEFDRRNAIRDSIYANIEANFQPQISNRIDSLNKIRDDKCRQRDALMLKLKARSK